MQGKTDRRLGLGIALTLAALAWGFVNFGILLWLPGSLVAEGRSVSLASALIAKSALIAVPTVVVATWLYSLWSTRRVLILAIGITTLGAVCNTVSPQCRPRPRQPSDLGVIADRRHQRGHLYSDALRGGEFSCQKPGQGNRVGRRMQQNRRGDCPDVRCLRARSGIPAGGGRCCDSYGRLVNPDLDFRSRNPGQRPART